MGTAERVIITKRTIEKDLRMSEGYIMTKEEWLSRGATYRGSVGEAAKSRYFTVRQCEKMKLPVSQEELCESQNFAVMKNNAGNWLTRSDGTRTFPCIPVFYRSEESESTLDDEDYEE